jgi:hypothetical protein
MKFVAHLPDIVLGFRYSEPRDVEIAVSQGPMQLAAASSSRCH